jgi:NAD(P)-dependent dehydrogenase (short-subunit alcohol dehydrogenase family)
MNPQYDFRNNIALVTGAGKGMGLATPTAFAESGPPLRSRTSTKLRSSRSAIEQVRDQLVAAGHHALAVRCDVSDEADIAAMVSTTVNNFWPLGRRIQRRPCPKSRDQRGRRESAGRFDLFNGINLRGVWAYLKHELHQMRAGLGCNRQLLLTGWSRGQPGGWPTGGALVEDSRPWR